MSKKSTYELDPEVKRQLALWRVELRSRDLPATEKAIIEVLVRSTNLESVARLFRNYSNAGSDKQPTATRSLRKATAAKRR